MRVTKAMIQAAQRGEFDYYQRGRRLGAERFIPTPPEIVRAMLEAALNAVQPDHQDATPTEAVEKRPKLTIVTARKPEKP